MVCEKDVRMLIKIIEINWPENTKKTQKHTQKSLKNLEKA